MTEVMVVECPRPHVLLPQFPRQLQIYGQYLSHWTVLFCRWSSCSSVNFVKLNRKIKARHSFVLSPRGKNRHGLKDKRRYRVSGTM
jgi:hypothetical protein